MQFQSQSGSRSETARQYESTHNTMWVLELLALSIVLVALSWWASNIGSFQFGATELFDAVFRSTGTREQIIITEIRIPRVLTGILVGMALASAGAIMQAITNNPLASPGLLGLNSGAAFCVVMGIFLFGHSSRMFFVWYAFIGAAIAAFFTYSISSIGKQGATPLKLTLVGAMISSFFAAVTAAILIFDQETLGAVRLWTVGSLKGAQLTHVASVAPYIFIGLVSALLFSRQLTALSLGGDMARSLGQNVPLWRILCAGSVVLLGGSAVALAGPIGFVGLIVPHISRFIVGTDYRKIIPFTTLFGACLVVAADTAFRQLTPDRDIPVGITLAVLGAPFFIYLARYRIGAR